MSIARYRRRRLYYCGVMLMVKTAAQKKAQAGYMAKFKRPYIRLLPDEYQAVVAAASKAGESLHTYMYNAVMDKVKKEGQA